MKDSKLIQDSGRISFQIQTAELLGGREYACMALRALGGADATKSTDDSQSITGALAPRRALPVRPQAQP